MNWRGVVGMMESRQKTVARCSVFRKWQLPKKLTAQTDDISDWCLCTLRLVLEPVNFATILLTTRFPKGQLYHGDQQKYTTDDIFAQTYEQTTGSETLLKSQEKCAIIYKSYLGNCPSWTVCGFGSVCPNTTQESTLRVPCGQIYNKS